MLWNKIKKLFSEAEKSTLANPAIHEELIRSSEDEFAYHNWLGSESQISDIQTIMSLYIEHKKTDKPNIGELSFLNTVSKLGFVINLFSTEHSFMDPVHLIDLFKNRTLDLGYVLYVSDKKVYNRSSWVETLQRHYLKPPTVWNSSKKIDQLYGNVTIELIQRNDLYHELKFSATRYKDHMFEPAYDFDELMKRVFY